MNLTTTKILCALATTVSLTGQAPYLVKDIRASGASTPHQLADGSGTLWFSAYDTRPRLFLSQGDAASTVAIADLATRSHTRVGNRMFFVATSANGGLYVSDGTSPGTVRIAPITISSSLTALGNCVLFTRSDSANGVELWKSDGTPSGTGIVKDIYPGTIGSAPSDLIELGGKVYFSANEPQGGRELYVSDGTAGGTLRVSDINPGTYSSTPRGMTRLGNRLVFSAHDGSTGRELWSTDGTNGGTRRVVDLLQGRLGADPKALIANSRYVFFSSWGKMYRSDGTAGGTIQLPSVMSEIAGTRAVLNDVLLFQGRDGTQGFELWRTDGTPSGTQLVKEIRAGINSSFPGDLTTVGTSHVIFRAVDDGNGSEPWVTDGSTVGTRLLDVRRGPASSGPDDFTVSGGRVYFSADDGVHGTELWAWQPSRPASYTYIDQRTPYRNQIPPMLVALNLPELGRIFELDVPSSRSSGGNGRGDYWLATGLSNPDLAVAAFGGFLFTSAELLSPIPLSAAPRTTVSLPIPMSSQLLGLEFYQQVLQSVCTGTTPATCTNRLSRGGLGVIGQ